MDTAFGIHGMCVVGETVEGGDTSNVLGSFWG